MSKWIAFNLAPVRPSRKTGIWAVVTKGGAKEVGGLVLGHVSWWAQWRKYAFFPAQGTLYEQTCLRDIAEFIDDQMKLRRKP